MKRVNHNFLQSLITQYEYNSELNKLDNQLTNLKKLPRPFRLRNKLSHSIETVEYMIQNINDNLFEICMKTGTDKIFDAIYLKYNQSIKDLFVNSSKKEKNLLYFYNHVFVSVTINIYKKSELDFENNSDSIIPYEKTSKINKKQYDIQNIFKSDGRIKCFEMIKRNKSF